jgi:hypothetical protein
MIAICNRQRLDLGLGAELLGLHQPRVLPARISTVGERRLDSQIAVKASLGRWPYCGGQYRFPAARKYRRSEVTRIQLSF